LSRGISYFSIHPHPIPTAFPVSCTYLCIYLLDSI
jgi:hypothetical protein